MMNPELVKQIEEKISKSKAEVDKKFKISRGGLYRYYKGGFYTVIAKDVKFLELDDERNYVVCVCKETEDIFLVPQDQWFDNVEDDVENKFEQRHRFRILD